MPPEFTHVVSNLPGVMQRLDLIRDTLFAFGLPDLPPNVVETRNSLTGEDYAAEDGRLQKKNRSCSKGEYDPDRHQGEKDKAKKKRHEKEASAAGIGIAQSTAQANTTEVNQEMDKNESMDTKEEAASSDQGDGQGGGENMGATEYLLLKSVPANEEGELEQISKARFGSSMENPDSELI